MSDLSLFMLEVILFLSLLNRLEMRQLLLLVSIASPSLI